ncbi:MAG: Holliday junction branch migration protein RuvA [bacterium]
MIARLTGTIIDIGEKFVVIDVHGVGYKVACANDTLQKLSIDTQTSLHTYLAVREDALDLYGFASMQEKNFFELLISVSGIGPKGALGILSATSIDTLAHAIGTGDTSYLTKVSGIGRKTAEKIVIELRDKMHAHTNDTETPASLRSESDIIEALKALGYSQNESREALKEISQSVVGTNARIKEALKILGKR